jgi:hypothetical protein
VSVLLKVSDIVQLVLVSLLLCMYI